MHNYIEFYNIFEKKLCRKIFGITTVSNKTLEARIRTLMDKAISINNKELATVAYDLTSSSSNLCDEMDTLRKKIKNNESENIQRANALKETLNKF